MDRKIKDAKKKMDKSMSGLIKEDKKMDKKCDMAMKKAKKK